MSAQDDDEVPSASLIAHILRTRWQASPPTTTPSRSTTPNVATLPSPTNGNVSTTGEAAAPASPKSVAGDGASMGADSQAVTPTSIPLYRRPQTSTGALSEVPLRGRFRRFAFRNLFRTDDDPDHPGVPSARVGWNVYGRVYHSTQVPNIKMEDYVKRLMRYFRCSPECWAIALALIDRLAEATQIAIDDLNVYRVLLTALLVATKSRDDMWHTMSYYAHVGGISAAELRSLEVHFMFSISWNLIVPEHLYNSIARGIELSCVVARPPVALHRLNLYQRGSPMSPYLSPMGSCCASPASTAIISPQGRHNHSLLGGSPPPPPQHQPVPTSACSSVCTTGTAWKAIESEGSSPVTLYHPPAPPSGSHANGMLSGPIGAGEAMDEERTLARSLSASRLARSISNETTATTTATITGHQRMGSVGGGLGPRRHSYHSKSHPNSKSVSATTSPTCISVFGSMDDLHGFDGNVSSCFSNTVPPPQTHVLYPASSAMFQQGPTTAASPPPTSATNGSNVSSGTPGPKGVSSPK